MSQNYVLDRVPPLLYDEFLASLPQGLTVAWRSDSGKPFNDRVPRVYVDGIDHVLVLDGCNNAVVVRRASEHDRRIESDRVEGEAVFEQWRLGGSIDHVDRAMRLAYGCGLFDIVHKCPATESDGKLCPRCRRN